MLHNHTCTSFTPDARFAQNLKPSISGLRWHSTTHPAVKKTARALFLSRFRGGSDTLGLAEMVGRWMNVGEWICLSRKLVIKKNISLFSLFD